MILRVLLFTLCFAALLNAQAKCTGCPSGFALGDVRYASDFPGADCGAKINAALSDGGATARVFVDQTCGTTISTAVPIGATQVVEFIECGTWTQSAIITAGHLHGVEGVAPWPGGGSMCVILKQAASTNLTRMIHVTSDAATIKDIELDGTTATNTTTDGIFVDGARDVLIQRVKGHAMPDDGLIAQSSSTSNNDAAIVKIVGSIFSGNDGDGYQCEDLTDTFVSRSGFDGNTGNGIRLVNCSAGRFEQFDIGATTGNGLHITGVNTSSIGHGAHLISGCNMGGNAAHDIFIEGHDGTGNLSRNNIITNCIFRSTSARTADTWDAIRLKDTAGNVLSNLIILSDNTNTYEHGVHIEDTGQSGNDWLSGIRYENTFGTATQLILTGETSFLNSDQSNELASDLTIKHATSPGFVLTDTTTPVSVIYGVTDALAQFITITGHPLSFGTGTVERWSIAHPSGNLISHSTNGGVLVPHKGATEPESCTTTIEGAYYLDTSDDDICFCLDDGTDVEWLLSAGDRSHASGHCTF